MAYDDHVDEMHFSSGPRPALTIAEKARRVDHALRTERSILRKNKDQDLTLANTLNHFSVFGSDDTKARLFDLIVGISA